MNNLIQIVNSEPRVSHRTIAEETNNKQDNINQLITKHLSDFQEFGTLHVDISKVQTKGGLQKQKTYYLNEAQATLLMTYLRNSDVVRNVKKALVREFFSMRETLNNNTNLKEIYGRIGGLESANRRYREQILHLEHMVKQIPNKKECVLPHKLMGKNSLLDFIGSVQKQQQCIKMMFDEMCQRRS